MFLSSQDQDGVRWYQIKSLVLEKRCMTNEGVSILSAESIMFGRGELIVLKFQNVQNEKYSDCL